MGTAAPVRFADTSLASAVTEVVARDSSTTAAALLTRLASETSMLTALSEVLSRHHAEAQQRLVSAGRVSSDSTTSADATAVLTIEYPGGGSVDVQPTRTASQVLALMPAPDADAIPGAPRARSSSPAPRDRTPAASGALVVRTQMAAQLAARSMTSGSIREILDYALTDSDYSSVLALLATVGGNTGAPPASAAAIAALPDIELGATEAEASCAICLTELGQCGPTKALPCGSGNVPHAFHAQCITAWLRLHSTCPTCRARLAEPGAQLPLAPAGST